MAVTELAEVSAAYYLGELTAMAGIPVVGLILLIVGLRRRSRSRPQPPGYPPPGQYPYGPPPPGGRSVPAINTNRDPLRRKRYHSITRPGIHRTVPHDRAQR